MNTTNPATQESAATAALLAAVVLIALVAALLGWTNRLEAFSFITGAACVWLTVKQNIWNFPVGLANVAAYCIVFFQSRLFADAGLQIVYFVLGTIGWYLWLHGDKDQPKMQVKRASQTELAVLGILATTGTLALWHLLDGAGGSAPFWDGLTTSISLVSQWLLNRKRLENWIGWIVVDIIYVPLYAYKELYLTALLYAMFLIMAILGLRAWRQSWLAQSATDADPRSYGNSAL